MSLEIDVQEKGLPAFDWTRRAVDWADRVGPMMAAGMKRAAPVGKGPGAGRLRDSIMYSRKTGIGELSIEYTTNVPYAPYVIHDTRPHEIHATAALALHWLDARGGDMFAKFVHHPGTHANRFPQRAADEQAEWMRAEWRRTMTEGM